MTAPVDNRTVALAGLYQSVSLVSDIAWDGQVAPMPFKASLASLFKIDADTFEDVYGGWNGIKVGLQVLHDQLTNDDKERRLEHTRYAVTLLYLEKRLSRSPAMIATIQEGIGKAREQLAHFDLTHINVVCRLADTYQQSISRLRPRIMVQGDQSHLTNPDNASRIRALLLAGIRAAVLWRQAGGTRWRLLFGRKALLRDVEALLTET
jgi:high frequency lysogenization protein